MSAILTFMVGRMAGPIFAALALALLIANGVQWGVWTWQVSLIERDRDDHKARIEDPTNGYVRQVSQCLTNAAGFEAGLKRAGDSIDALAKATEARDGNLAKDMAAASKTAKAAFATSAKVLLRPTITQPGTLESCRAGEAYLRGKLP